MRTVTAILLTIALSAVWAGAQTPQPTDAANAAIRFAAFDVFIDAGDVPLAAYQIEISDPSGRSMIVGVEGGAEAAFVAPPYYDPAALHGEGRIILAAYTTDDAPSAGKTRVARLHLRIEGEPTPDFDVQLTVAADSDGVEIDATAMLTPTLEDSTTDE